MSKSLFKLVLAASAFSFLLSSCEKTYVPKPKGYPRIDFETPRYVRLPDEYPYTFEYSDQARAFDDTFNLYEPNWIHVYYPAYDANVQITYKNVKEDEKKFHELVNDALRLANKHNIKAYSIEERVIKNPAGKTAVVIDLAGDVPSHFQFYITDTTEHFLRAALYFPVANRSDSLAPVIQYIKKDMLHMINTLDWKDPK